jgi:hypothetical protein
MKLLNRYPVETRSHIKHASRYFDENWSDFTIAERVAYAQQLAYAADAMGVEISEKVASYVGVPRQDISAGMKMRKYLTGGHYDDVLQEIEKRASVEGHMAGVVMLDEFDRTFGLDKSYSRVLDPYETMFMKVSEAQQIVERDAVWRGPTDSLSQAKFESWVRDPKSKQLLQASFTPDLAIELIRDPWVVYMSLPDPHKQIIARMVNDNVVNNLNSPGRSIYDYDGALNQELLDESPMRKLDRISKNDPTIGQGRVREAVSSLSGLDRVSAAISHSIDKKHEHRMKGRI